MLAVKALDSKTFSRVKVEDEPADQKKKKKENITWTADGMKLHIVFKSTEEEAIEQLLKGPTTQ